MGEVYRAHDPEMGRDVAIKVSQEKFGSHFEREVRAVAALNHPNICQVYDVGPNYLVMELIEGTPLKGPYPEEQSLRYASQIAHALEAAHDRGIIHCDLKPDNIRLQADGRVKVLDFGLAKWVTPAPTPRAGVSSATERTITLRKGDGSSISGTPAYMSPEQVRGLGLDKRSDVWAFGVVLHELLTGKRPFSGGSVADIFAAVLNEEPDLREVPLRIRPVLRACLCKDPVQRLRAAADFPHLIANTPTPVANRERFWKVAVAAAALSAVLSMGGIWALRKGEAKAKLPDLRFQFTAPNTFNSVFFLSPDGSKVGYTAAGADGRTQIWIQSLNSLRAVLLAGTDDAGSLTWSPDSRFIAFSTTNKLKKTDSGGGPVVDICDLAFIGDTATERPGVILGVRGATWNSDGVIVFGIQNVLYRVPASGGKPVQLTSLAVTRREAFHARPHFLSDGRRFLYLRSSEAESQSGIFSGSIDMKPDDPPSPLILNTPLGVEFASQEPGHLLYLRNGTLMAHPFEERSLKFSGEAVPVAENVGDNGIAAGYFSSARNGILVYRGQARDMQLTICDRAGKEMRRVGEGGVYNSLALSPDGRRIITERVDPRTRATSFWLFDLQGGASMRFASESGNVAAPVWSPSDQQIIFAASHGDQHALLRRKVSGGGEAEVIQQSTQVLTPSAWSSDGAFLIGYGSLGTGHLWHLPLRGAKEKPRVLFPSQFNEVEGRLSPDDRWLAYRSNQSGRFEVYVRALRHGKDLEVADSEWMISKGGGDSIRWRRDGRELFYMAPDGSLMSVQVQGGDEFQFQPPMGLFRTAGKNRSWDVMPDGQSFVIAVPAGGSDPVPFTVVSNWRSTLSR